MTPLLCQMQGPSDRFGLRVRLDQWQEDVGWMAFADDHSLIVKSDIPRHDDDYLFILVPTLPRRRARLDALRQQPPNPS